MLIKDKRPLVLLLGLLLLAVPGSLPATSGKATTANSAKAAKSARPAKATSTKAASAKAASAKAASATKKAAEDRPAKNASTKPARRGPAKAAKKASKKSKKKPGKKKLKLRSWLALGGASAPLPLFHKETKKKYTYKHLLATRHLQLRRMRPVKGESHDWYLGQSLTWQPSKGRFKIQGKGPQVGYLATYLQVPQYLELKLELRSHQRLRVFLNGRAIATQPRCTKLPKKKKAKQRKKSNKSNKSEKSKTKSPVSPKAGGLLGRLAQLLERQARIIEQQSKTIARHNRALGAKKKKKPKAGLLRAHLRLTPGVHQLVVKSLYAPGCVAKWGVKASLHGSKKQPIPQGFKASSQPEERHSIGFMLRRKQLRGASLNPTGDVLLLWLFRRTATGKAEYWMEQRNVKDGMLVYSTRALSAPRMLKWSPDGESYTFVTRSRRSRTLWLRDLNTGKTRALRRNIKNLRSYAWSPDSRFLVLNIAHREKPSKLERAGAKRLRGMGDRWPWYRLRSHLYSLSVKAGHMHRLTSGKWSIWGPVFRHDGKKLLFARTRPDFRARPFRRQDLYELDIPKLKAKKILGKLRWMWSFQYSPNGKKLLLTGGSSLFGKLGSNLPKGTTPNEYDTQAYLYDPKTKKKSCLTLKLKASVRNAYWHPVNNKLYLTVLDGTRFKLVEYAPKTKRFFTIPTRVDIAYGFSFARKATQIAYLGQGVTHPGRLFTLNLAKPRAKMLYAPAKAWFSRLKIARVKDFDTIGPKARKLRGRIYLPPGFDPKKKYPAIVYYYGGTYPTTRRFDGRYPGHLWAAHGFVVYKLQPSGALGFGQKHSARHVNEWGSIVAEEIIQATKAFVKAHPFVDGKRLGCIGASYGGFMTMSIVTKTKLFAAAISHAGISNITSYWGAGFWGYLYSAIATAHRYPWTHPYFYVKNSPLFHAHKVTTPLLLLHGAGDTNVPPSESFQMYTALRLLKKQVELVLFKRENHWILKYRKRIVWTQTILAWFSKHLKKQPLWWKRLHGTKQH